MVERVRALDLVVSQPLAEAQVEESKPAVTIHRLVQHCEEAAEVPVRKMTIRA
jgi:hypothetical protein